MLATIGIEKLSVMALIGIFEHERKGVQELLIDIKLECDIGNCLKSDAIGDAMNYALLADRCQEFASQTSFNLIESFASALLDDLLSQFPISRLWIRVSKPNALKNAKFPYVEVEKTL